MIWFNNLVARILPFVPKPIVGLFSRQYIAGEALDDAIRAIKELNANGICATIDLLGEEVKQRSDSELALKTYISILNTIASEGVDANVSVKPTHMGLKIDKEFCYQNLKILVESARQHNNFIRIDMEDSSCVDDTLDIYERLRTDYINVGTVMQAYLRRAVDDVNRLIPKRANLRLCKGAYYWEKRDVVYKDGAIVNRSYEYLLEKLLSQQCYVGIATHDEKLVWAGLRLIDKYQLTHDQYEFQMLYGVDPELARIVTRDGHKLRVYVPFGKEWFAYSVRRLRENPKMVSYIMKNTVNRMFGINR
ncbi:proline dehydrogenase family protein [candidate division KSB1 bacterium]|nr:proline dehydrogenase family protein [candidate division KSB1 bacterium]